jgi:hypothetical protein
MKSTVQAILTDVNAREAEAVEVQLAEELSAGSPWFNEGQ